jgi:hypothetical protein
MGVKIFGYKKSGTSTNTADVSVRDFDNFWGLDTLNIPITHQKVWEGSAVSVGGINDSIGSDYEDLSNYDADNNYLSGIRTLYISGSAVGDSYNLYASETSGGARIIRVNYLDSNWEEKSVDVYPSGLVSSQIPTSDFYRLNNMEVVSVGVSGTAAGNICLVSFLENVVTKYLVIDQDTNESYGGYYYVPAGKNLIITDAGCYPRLDSHASLEFAFKIEEPKIVGSTTNYIENYAWAGSYVSSNSNSSYNMPTHLVTPMIVKEKCRVRMRVKSDGSDVAKAIGYFKGYLVEEQ